MTYNTGREPHDIETRDDNGVAGVYTYNADGQRVRRNVGAVETWQIYGLSGELLAEYAANAASVSPQKEYGYRNGQLLITATIESGLAANAPPSPGGADAGSAGILPAMSAQREPGLSPTSGSPTGQPGWGGTVAEGVGRSLIFTKPARLEHNALPQGWASAFFRVGCFRQSGF
jgi:hypothetical protein